MIDVKYNPEAFRKAFADEELLDKICADLSMEIQWELHQALEEYIQSVVTKLNQMGHDLRGFSSQDVGEFSYRDDFYDNFQNYNCQLRTSLDSRVYTTCYENQ